MSPLIGRMSEKWMEISIVLMVDGDCVWLAQRAADAKSLPGLWETGGGKVEPGEHPSDAAVREMKEETGLDLSNKLIPCGMVFYRHDAERTSNVVLYMADLNGLVPRNPEPSKRTDWERFIATETEKLPMTPATRALVQMAIFNETGR